MKRKLKSKKFWITILTDIIAITLIFKEVGGRAGIIAGVIGSIATLLIIILTHKKVDFFITKDSKELQKKIIKSRKK